MMNRIWIRLHPLLAFWVWAVLRLAAPQTGAAEDIPSFAGVYRDERITVELDRPTRSGLHDLYTGTIQLGDQKFPLKAEAAEERLRGSFEDQGDHFEFVASVIGRMLVLTTDGTTYRLKKQSINPLARSTKPNPLAPPRTNTPAAGSPLTNATVSPSPVVAASHLRFRRYSLLDDTNMIGGEAFTMLIPADWQVEGGLSWRMHPTLPASIVLRAGTFNGTEVVEIFPTVPFVWAEGGIPLFPSGSNYMGNEVGEPMEDPVAYVQKIILPRFRRNVPAPQIVSTEEMPKVADAITETSQEPGLQKKFRAARIRIEYMENKRVMQEDIYCVLALTYAPTLRISFWGPDRNYSFKAEKGKLETRGRVCETVINSIRPNLEWFNRYVQLVQTLVQSQLDTTRPASELSRFVVRISGEIPEPRRQLFQKQQVAQDRIDSVFSQYVRGLEEYRNPFDNRTMELPGGYSVVWANPTGEVMLSDDSAYTPNTAAGGDWQKAQKNH